MSRPVFTWFPDVDSQLDAKPNVTVTKFGDGYEARAPDGLNSQPQKWSLTFFRTRTEGKDIIAFLKARGAVEAFDWTTPLEDAGVYVCRGWRAKPNSGTLEITCDFEQVFEY